MVLVPNRSEWNPLVYKVAPFAQVFIVIYKWGDPNNEVDLTWTKRLRYVDHPL